MIFSWLEWGIPPLAPNDIALVVAGVTAVATTVYTIGTFLLWRATHSSFRIVRDQLELQRSANRAQAYLEVVRSHREVSSLLLDWQPAEMRRRIALPSETAAIDPREGLVANALINHSLATFYFLDAGVLDEELWMSYRRDVQSLFARPFVRDQWEKTKDFYPDKFKLFVGSGVVLA